MSKQMNNEWLEKLLRGENRNEISQYTDLVNRRSPLDDVGDAFLDQSKQPVLNGGQALGNSVKAGLGAGFKANANAGREDKLREIEQYTKDSALATAELQAQLGEQRLNELSYTKYANNSYVDLLKLKDAYVAEDMNSFNQLGMQFYNNFAQAHPELVEGIGKIDHIYNGKAYFNNDNGETEGFYIKDLLEPLISKLSEDKQRELMPLMSTTMQNKFRKSDLFEDLSLREKQSSINANNANSNLRNAQAKAAEHEMNTSKVDEYGEKLKLVILKDRAAKNYTTVGTEIMPRIKANENVLEVYELFEDLIKNNPRVVGNDLKAKAWRTLATAFGLDADIDYANLKSVEFEKMLKPILGAQLGQAEGERLLGKFINLDMNPDAISKFLKEEKPRLMKEIVRDKQKVDYYTMENHGNLYDEGIHSNIDQAVNEYSTNRATQKTKTQEQQQGVVEMQAPDGSIRSVPKDQIKKWESKGAKVVNE